MLLASLCLLSGLLAGCRPSADQLGPASEGPPADPRANEPLRLAVIDDLPLATAIQREWQAQAEGSLTVQQVGLDEDIALAAREAEVIIFPMCELGELIEAGWLRPFPTGLAPDAAHESAGVADYDWDDVFPLLRREELRWGPLIYGVPFGSPQLVLHYRQDLLREWGLAVPETWSQYQLLLQQLHQQIAVTTPDQAPRPYATVEPLGPRWAARSLLARAAAYVRHRSQYSTLFHFGTMQPLINQPPFVRALQEMTQAVAYQPAEALQISPFETPQLLLDGQVVLAVGWPSAARQGQDADGESREVGFAELPGSEAVYRLSEAAWQQRGPDETVHVPTLGLDGRMGAVTRSCRRVQQAGQLLLWLTAREQSTRVASQSVHTTLFRQSQLPQPRHWVEPQLIASADQYASVLAASQHRPSWLTMLRIPGQADYLAALDQAVRSALEGKTTPQEALDQVAEAWTRMTQQRDIDRQRTAYLRDLGL